MARRSKRRISLPQADDHLDLVPLIDCIFLLLLFFMLCGRLSTDNRTEQITVPPTITAMKFTDKAWHREVINVFGTTQAGTPPRNTISLGSKQLQGPTFEQHGINSFQGYQELRTIFDQIYDQADKYQDPNPKVKDADRQSLPMVTVEIRADVNTEFRVVQEIQQVLSDTVDPSKDMQPKRLSPSQMKSFVNIEFTTRTAGDAH